MKFSEENPLPIRHPVTDPPVKGEHVDIGVWPDGWRFLTSSDRARFERLSDDEQALYRRAFDQLRDGLADR